MTHLTPRPEQACHPVFRVYVSGICASLRPMTRLDQLLSSLGYCSRREARDWVKAGAVLVRGVEANDVSARVAAADVTVDGAALDHPEGLLLLLHKPLGLVCSHDEREGPNIYSLLPTRWRRRNPGVTSI